MTKGKRLLDLTASVLGLAILWPLLLLIAVVVKVHDGGPVFFRQVRVGHRARLFRLWKFRTMVPNAPSGGSLLTVEKDPRLTRVGGWLRDFKLDELPQLFNVVAGDMSLVGPRPEVPRHVALYTSEQRRVLDYVPGITDEASIRYVEESEILAQVPDPERTYIETIMPEKIRLSLEYARRATWRTDMGLVGATVRQIIRRRTSKHTRSAADAAGDGDSARLP